MTLLKTPVTDIKHLIPQKTPFVMIDTLLGFSATIVVSSFKVFSGQCFF